MNNERRQDVSLPSDVAAALQRGNKIEAIKRLRDTHRLSLKDAKDAVERHVRNDPVLARQYAQRAAQSVRVMRFIIIVAIVLAVAYMLLQE